MIKTVGIPNNSGKRWSALHDTMLRKMWGQVKAKQIAARLGRSYMAVRCRAAYLGLRSDLNHYKLED